MKKVIIGLSGVVVLALAVVLFVNAGTGSKEEKKATTELKADCGKCPSAAKCTDAAKSETATATHAGCTEAKADSTKACCPEAAKMASAPSCEATCPMKKATLTK